MISDIYNKTKDTASYLAAPAISGVQAGCHLIGSVSKILAIPELLAKISHLAAATLTLFPTLTATAKPILYIAKDAKEYFNIFKGAKAIESLLFKCESSWKKVVRDVSSFALLVFSSLYLADKFKLISLSTTRILLSQVPYLGVLSYAGLPSIATITLLGSLFFIAIDKQKELNQFTPDKANEKIKKWKEKEAEPSLKKTKVEKWSNKILKHDLENRSNKLYMIQRITGIAGLVFASAGIIAGLQPLLILGGCFTFVEIACGAMNLYVQYRMSKIKIQNKVA